MLRSLAKLRRGVDPQLASALALLALGVLALWFSSPRHGEFWWSDSPRHALNGVFVMDLIAAHPFAKPAAWAMQYYVQYPALTILFYPPLFYVLSAPFYAAFGVSHQSALMVVMLHFFAASCGLYLLARRWIGHWAALGVALLLLAAPGVALWGRQVMLEIPALAFAIWAMWFLRRYEAGARPVLLYAGAFLMLCALYTKISAMFLLPVAFAMLLKQRTGVFWRDRHAWIAAGLFAAGAIPLVILTLKFGRANVQSVVGIADAAVSRTTISGWTWYARQLPEQLGWPLLAATFLCAVVAIGGRKTRGLWSADAILIAGWFLVGYVYFSAIDLKEARHSTLLLPPLLILLGVSARAAFGARWAAGGVLAIAVLTAGWTWRYAPVPQVSGYREAAAWAARQVTQNSVILFSGKRDGSFIFNLRALDARRELYVVRADKLLLEVAVRRELGVKEKTYSQQEIGDMLDRYHIGYVVAQSDFWTDLEVMARLQSELRSDHFEEVGRIAVGANVPVEDKELRLYRNKHKLPGGPVPLKLFLPIIGAEVEGRTGN